MKLNYNQIKDLIQRISISSIRLSEIDIHTNYLNFQKQLTELKTLVDILDTSSLECEILIADEHNKNEQTKGGNDQTKSQNEAIIDAAQEVYVLGKSNYFVQIGPNAYELSISKKESETGTAKYVSVNNKKILVTVPPGINSLDIIKLEDNITLVIKCIEKYLDIVPDLGMKKCPVCGFDTLCTVSKSPLLVGCANKKCPNYLGALS
jgi:hypothetical protein